MEQKKLKIVHGAVNADGSWKSGDDFHSSMIDKGTYDIEFRPAFPTFPAVVVTQNYKAWDKFDYEGGATTDNAVVVAVDKNHCKIITGNSAGERDNRNFSFVAIG